MQIIFQDPYSSLNPRMTVNGILSDPMRGPQPYNGNERAGTGRRTCWKKSA